MKLVSLKISIYKFKNICNQVDNVLRSVVLNQDATVIKQKKDNQKQIALSSKIFINKILNFSIGENHHFIPPRRFLRQRRASPPPPSS